MKSIPALIIALIFSEITGMRIPFFVWTFIVLLFALDTVGAAIDYSDNLSKRLK